MVTEVLLRGPLGGSCTHAPLAVSIVGASAGRALPGHRGPAAAERGGHLPRRAPGGPRAHLRLGRDPAGGPGAGPRPDRAPVQALRLPPPPCPARGPRLP